MRKKINILLLLLSATIAVQAQDFQPGQEAQNLTEQKNVTVDYATGLFHYSVPLYTLRSGTYELPVSLDYIGKGVRMSDVQGTVGYNWTLNTGGVVTRVMRGGFPDENSLYGYLFKEQESALTQQDAPEVGLRKRDGESDIFTIMLGGRKIDFILRMNTDKHISAETLERTGVRIECDYQGGVIKGWTVTDENGDRYTYQQVGKSSDAQRLDVSTSGLLYQSSYNSAWYLTQIQPYNGSPINFYYATAVSTAASDMKYIQVDNFFDSYTMNYYYGKAIKEQTFDFEKYRPEYVSCIEEARYHLRLVSREAMMESVDRDFEELERYRAILSSPFADNRLVVSNNRIIGMLGEFASASNASQKMESTLSHLADYCAALSSSNVHTMLASSNLRAAANCIHRFLSEVSDTVEKEVAGGSKYTQSSPLLTCIMAPEHCINFDYLEIKKNQYHLAAVEFHHRTSGLRSSVSISKHNGCPEKIVFLDRKGNEVSAIRLGYYSRNDFPVLDNHASRPDYWFYPHIPGMTDQQTGNLFTLNSLKSITLPDGGTIGIEYEKNKVNGPVCGGVRLKSLMIADGTTGKKDTIDYDYPQSGVCLYGVWDYRTVVDYGGFQDFISYSKANTVRPPIVNTGNYGVYYPAVIETVRGKGKSIYRYMVTRPTETGHDFWANGLLTEKSVYDNNGKCLQTTRYQYQVRFPFNKQLPQIYPSDFYLDGEELEKSYKQQNSSYVRGDLLYATNIMPRLSPRNVNHFYYLTFGGKMVLTEETEYRMENEQPYKRTRYFHDIPDNTLPTRIESIAADGTVHTEVCKRVADMADGADEAIDRMKQQNRLSPVVKQLMLTDGRLQKETVVSYRPADPSGKESNILPADKRVYMPTEKENYTPTEKENVLYAHDEANYDLFATYLYQGTLNAYMPSAIDGRESRESRVYDLYGKQILECDIPISAADDGLISHYPNDVNPDIERCLWELRSIYPSIKNLVANIERYTDSQRFISFMQRSTEYRYISSFMDEITKEKPDYGLAKEFYVPITANDCRMVSVFRTEFEQASLQDAAKRYLSIYLGFLEELTSYETLEVFETLMYKAYEVNAPSHTTRLSLSLSLPAGIDKLRLYVLDDDNDPIQVNIAHGGENNTLTFENQSSSKLKSYAIDLSQYKGAKNVSLEIWAEYAALVPETATFQATSYNLSGTIYARFDQTGNAEFYTYDDAGRVTRVEDQYGKVVREYEYNQLINE